MLSLCLTNYNRYDMLIESFQHVYDDPRVTEIVISDDCSDIKIYRKLQAYCEDKPKIKLLRNERNLGMSLNKKQAIENASNDMCILFDSDNVLKRDYIDSVLLHTHHFAEHVILCPSFAKPTFDYRKYSNKYIQAPLKEVDDTLNMLLNTCNYVVHRHWYLKVYEHNPTIKASDTIHFNYLHLKAGGIFWVIPGLEYFHRVHQGSGFLADAEYNLRQAEKTKQMILKL